MISLNILETINLFICHVVTAGHFFKVIIEIFLPKQRKNAKISSATLFLSMRIKEAIPVGTR